MAAKTTGLDLRLRQRRRVLRLHPHGDDPRSPARAHPGEAVPGAGPRARVHPPAPALREREADGRGVLPGRLLARRPGDEPRGVRRGLVGHLLAERAGGASGRRPEGDGAIRSCSGRTRTTCTPRSSAGSSPRPSRRSIGWSCPTRSATSSRRPPSTWPARRPPGPTRAIASSSTTCPRTSRVPATPACGAPLPRHAVSARWASSRGRCAQRVDHRSAMGRPRSPGGNTARPGLSVRPRFAEAESPRPGTRSVVFPRTRRRRDSQCIVERAGRVGRRDRSGRGSCVVRRGRGRQWREPPWPCQGRPDIGAGPGVGSGVDGVEW